MAGFVDGEGNVTVTMQIRRNRPSPAYRAYANVANTKRDSLTIFMKYYGGKIYLRREKRRDLAGIKWADAYTWQCPVSATRRFLLEILPYLRIKKKHARILIRFIDYKNAFARGKRKGKGGSSPLTQEEIGFRERLRREVRLLNRKGKFARTQGGV